MWVGEKETTCSRDVADGIKKDIGDQVSFYKVVPGYDHLDFGPDNSETYVNEIIAALGYPDTMTESSK